MKQNIVRAILDTLINIARLKCILFHDSVEMCFRDHGVYMYVVYIRKWNSAYALGGVNGVESFITTNEQLQ